jgi:hypothetical protein
VERNEAKEERQAKPAAKFQRGGIGAVPVAPLTARNRGGAIDKGAPDVRKNRFARTPA